jgi:hypothetical protein
MPKKKRIGPTTGHRYRVKAMRVHGFGMPPRVLETTIHELALLQEGQRQEGFAPYHDAWLKAKEKLQALNVPSGLWGLYRSFVMELINKVSRRGLLSLEQLIEITVKKTGLDADVMRELADHLGFEVEKESTSPA